jgi:phage recombination protein Bet
LNKRKRRKPQKKRRPNKRRAISRKPHPQQQAMVVYKNNQPVRLNDHQVDLIKKLCAKDSTPEEFELFMTICKHSRLDPFKKQIYFVKFNTNDGPTMVIITGIDGYRSMAARDHKDFGGTSAAEFTWFQPERRTPIANKKIPETATVTAFRKGGVSATATVYWEEFAPADMTAKRSDFWRRMPTTMLEKCAEARALRKCYPSLGNIWTQAEMDNRLGDLTDGGREMHTDGVTPSGVVVDSHAAAKAAQQRVLDEKLAHSHPTGSPQAKNAEAAIQRSEAEDARLAAAKNITPKPAKPKQEKPAKPNPMAGMKLVTATLVRVIQSKTTNGVPVMDVQIGNTHYKCYHKNTLFPFLIQYGQMGGFNIQAFVNDRGTIEGLKKIGPVMFEDDGKTEKKFTREPGEEG